MPIRAASSKTSVGLMALLIVLLIDMGLGIWFWYRRQTSQENYGFTRMNLPTVDQSETPAPVYQPPAAAPGAASAAQKMSSEKTAGQQPSRKLQTSPIRPPMQREGPLLQTAAAFIAMQRAPKFQKSNVIRKWRHDFLSYPDLRAINDKYWNDHNALYFVLGTLRSPNFAKLIVQYAASADVQTFARELMAMPEVMAGGRLLLENPQVAAAAKNVRFPGLPPIGTLMKMGETGSAGTLNNSHALEQMQNDPNVGKFMQEQNAPVPLEGGPN